MTVLELVRHAQAESRDRWWGRPDRERPLTAEGQQQACALARDLGAGGPVAALYSSGFSRCVETLRPLATSLNLPIVTDERLGEATTLPVTDGGDAWVAAAWLAGRALAFTQRITAEHAGQRVVACSHGDVIPALMAALAGRDRLDRTDVRCRKGARFTLWFEQTRCVRVQHTEAPRL